MSESRHLGLIPTDIIVTDYAQWGLGYHQPRFSSLDGGWHWGAVGVRGDPEGLPGRGDDDPVVVAGDGGADMESHVARRHVEASAEGVIHFWARILEHTLITLYGRRYVRRGRYCILNVCQELLLSIEAGACSKDCWAGLRLGAKNRPHVGPDAVVQPLHTGRSKSLALIEDEGGPSLICLRTLCDVVDVLSRPKAAVCWQGAVRLETHAVSIPRPLGLVAVIILVDGPQTSAVGVFLAPVCRWVYAKFAAESLICTAVIGVLERVPGLILGKRYLQLVEDPAHLVIRVKPEYGSGKRPVNVKVVTPWDSATCGGTPYGEIHLILPEPHRICLPEAHDCLRANVWEPVFGEDVLDICCKVPSATGLSRDHYLDVGFQEILTSHVPGEPSACRVAHISVEGVGVRVHIDDDMFFMLTNVQSGAVALQEPIDNRNSNLRVGLCSITYMVGWYNVGSGESISWRAPSNNESRRSRPRSTTVAPGLYGIEDLIKLLEEAANDRSARNAISTNRLNGLLTLTVTNGWEVQITNGLLTLLGLDDGRGGRWLDSGAYDGDRPVNFTTTKSLHVHLNQLNTTKNFVDSAQSTLLTSVGIGRHAFGDIHTVSIPNPEFKRLCGGTSAELKVEIREDSGELLNNHSLPIAVTVEIQHVWVSMVQNPQKQN